MRQKNKLKLLSSLLLILVLSFSLSSCFEKEKKVKKNTNSLNIEDGESKEDKKTSEIIKKLESKGISKLSKGDSKILIEAYKNTGNPFFTKEENYDKAMILLNKVESNYEITYYKGYVNEVSKNYEKALKYYKEAVEDKSITKQWKIIILGKIGDIHNLKGEKIKSQIYNLKADKLVN